MAKFSFKCTRCGCRIKTDVGRIGTLINCRDCNEPLTVPLTGFCSGMVLGDFWVHHSIGVGAVSEVFLAKRLSNDEQVFLKVLSPLATVDEENVQRFIQAVSVSQQIDHPNIISVQEMGLYQDHYFLATRYVDGKCLDQIVEDEGPFSEKEALEICLKVAALMRRQWREHALVHQALKPANILMNDEREIFLLDVGNSKQLLVPPSGSIEEINPMGNLFDFMSPEQIQGMPNLDCSSDIYALGTTLFYLVTGTRPYEDTATTTIAQKHLFKPAPDPKTQQVEVSEATVKLIRAMMRDKREEEIDTWDDLIRRAKRILKGRTREGAVVKDFSRSHIKPITRPAFRKTPDRKRDGGERPRTRGERPRTRADWHQRHTSERLDRPLSPPPAGNNRTAIIIGVAAAVFFVIIGVGIWAANRGGGATTGKTRSAYGYRRLDEQVLLQQLQSALTQATQNPALADRYAGELRGLRRQTNDPVQQQQIDQTISQIQDIKKARQGEPHAGGNGGDGDSAGNGGSATGNTGLVKVFKFVIIKPGGNEEVGVLPNGATLNVHGNKANINIRADVSPDVKCVRFGFNGNSKYRVDTSPPFTLGPSYTRDFSIPVGKHVLVAVPYAETRATGKSGKPLHITFEVKK